MAFPLPQRELTITEAASETRAVALAMPAAGGAIDGWATLPDQAEFVVDGWCTSTGLPTLRLEVPSGSRLATVRWVLRYPRSDAAQSLALDPLAPISDRLGFVILASDHATDTDGAPTQLAVQFDATALLSQAPPADSPERAHRLVDAALSRCEASPDSALAQIWLAAQRGSLKPVAADTLPAPEPETLPLPRGHIDSWTHIGSRPGFLVEGWSANVSEPPELIECRVSGELKLLPAWTLRFARPDVARILGLDDEEAMLGFVLFAPAEAAPTDAPTLNLTLIDDAQRRAFEPFSPQALNHTRDVIAAQWTLRSDELMASFAPVPPPEILAAIATGPAAIDHAVAFHVDRIAEVPGAGVLVDGWLVDLGVDAAKLILVDEDTGAWANLADSWHRTERPDVSPSYAHAGAGARLPGFVALAPLAAPEPTAPPGHHQRHPRTLTAYAVVGSAGVAALRVPMEPARDVLDRVRAALGTFSSGQSGVEALMNDHLGPAIEAWLTAPMVSAEPARRQGFGTRVVLPRVSVVVVAGPHDLLRVQLARLAGDPGFAQCAELILVVDDRRLIEPTWQAARHWLALYGLPFELVASSGDLGYADAVNLGARCARGEFLAVLGGDCLPDQNGWLGPMLDWLTHDPACGAVGPRLMFGDGSPHSLGLQLAAHPEYPTMTAVGGLASPGWSQGPMGRDATPGPLRVDAVSGACLVTRHEWFLRLGGFERGFLFTGHEDAVYCRRLAACGLRTCVLPQVSLVHLHGLSRAALARSEPLLADPAWKTKLDLYNAWLLSRRLKAAAAP